MWCCCLDEAGRALLADVPVVFTTPSGAGRLGERARGLADWQTVQIDSPSGVVVSITGVPAIHGRGEREFVESYAGPVVGFILQADGLPTVYVSGDNGRLDLVEEIAARIGSVDTAFIFAGAPRFPHIDEGALVALDSAQAAEAARILGATTIVPVHFDAWAHFTEGRDELQAAFDAAGLGDRVNWGVRA